MKRLTRRIPGGSYYILSSSIQNTSSGFTGSAADRLAQYENLYPSLLEEQKSISAQLKQLRLKGKTSSYQFRELMSQKLLNSGFLALLERYGLDSEPLE
jgi:hypothetical protein